MNAGTMNLALLVVFIGMIYLMMIRPQRKRDKETKEMRASLKVGDEIITIGGLVGKIVGIKDDIVVIETAHRTKVEMLKSSVGSVTKSTGKAKDAADTKADKEEQKDAPKAKKVSPKKLGAKKAEKEVAEEAAEVAETPAE